VESFPIETTLDHADVPNAPDVWLAMIEGAKKSIDLAEFYASEAETDALLATSKLAPIVDALERATRRGVRVRFLADALFAKTYPLTLERLAKSGASVRRLDVAKTSGGVLHAKYFVVDGEEAYLGSQNFDWRALAHIFEMGVRLRSREIAGAMLDVFETDWEIAGGAPKTTRIRAHAVASALPAENGERVSFVASPRGWLPHEEEWDLPRLLAMIDGARRALHVEVLTYKTKSRDGSAFHDLDDALRRAAARGVEVRLLVSDWASRPGSDARRDLDALARLPHVEVRVLRIPKWSGGDIPFARVAHAKFMIADGKDAWVGTSNWEGDYFTASRNVGAIASGGRLPAALDGVFDANWTSPYAAPLAEIDERAGGERRGALKGEPPRADAGPP
jgi:phosphatidylserine/phosphatidylglycerophosphate/cardiolipin synthase-like enzyme